jgi:rare lipoprotein A
MTAAHRTLPFGAQIKVINLRNKRTIKLTVTDRGPFVINRILDLSWAGARKLGFINQGLTKCKLVVL